MKIWRIAVPILLVALLVAGGLYYRSHQQSNRLTEKDTIVLADFANSTGDAVFDDTLKQALSVALNQSPFLNVLSDSEVAKNLKLMTRPAGTKLTPEVTRELCQRAGSKAYIAGSIASLGSEYVLVLKAVNCQSGDPLAEKQVTAASKEKVLDALGKAASKLRGDLGESLATVQKFDVPLEQATTSSLEALKAYSLGRNAMLGKGEYVDALPLFQRAINLDPNFAMAYFQVGACYDALGEASLGVENTRKAFELRERVGEREKLTIEADYYFEALGDLEKARQAYEVLVQTYSEGRIGLGAVYFELGQYDKSLAEFREGLRVSPQDGLIYGSIALNYLAQNRFNEGRAIAEEAMAKKLDAPELRIGLYALAFVQNDAAGMAQQVRWSEGKPGVEDFFLGSEAETAAYSGQLERAQTFTRRAVALAERAKENETAASYGAEAAVTEALFGNATEARRRAGASLSLSTGRDVQYAAALALAIAGDTSRPQRLADNLGQRFPEDTIVQFNYPPALHAQLACNAHDCAKAIEILQAAAPYEMATMSQPSVSLYPVYERGQAYLAAHQGIEAAAEFQKILDHRGIVLNEPIGAFAHLQIGRAYAMQGDTAKAKAAYQDFLTLWKDADPDIPILKQAKAEFTKLQ